MLLCFFFQAEDGIRDISVTGVQTCALPIYEVAVVGWTALHRAITPRAAGRFPARSGRGVLGGGRRSGRNGLAGRHGRARRSEERRVGKGCRCPRWPYN